MACASMVVETLDMDRSDMDKPGMATPNSACYGERIPD
jgi:hypothetical protein